MNKVGKIELNGANNTKGPTFSREMYDSLVDSILECTNNHPDGVIAFEDLIESVGQSVNGILPWHILQVKVDLQERGILKISHDRHRRQIIMINPRSRRSLRNLK